MGDPPKSKDQGGRGLSSRIEFIFKKERKKEVFQIRVRLRGTEEAGDFCAHPPPPASGAGGGVSTRRLIWRKRRG